MSEDALIPLSGLQHVVFCERQAALIHVERVWVEDAATAAGRIVHERVDLPGRDHRHGVRVARGVALASERLGIVGRADAVEYLPAAGLGGVEQPVPVEYKRGKVKHLLADQVQLCAQGLCLEEMHGVGVPEGALYYASSHRRVAVRFDTALRRRTEAAAARLRELIERRDVPRALREPKCKSCSLEPVCLPQITSDGARARRHLERLLTGASGGEEGACP